MPGRDAAKKKLKADLKVIVDETRRAFEGLYAEELKALQGLSQVELDALIPKGTDPGVYLQLIEVVKSASASNLKQAELKARIEALGSAALAIAKKVGPLAALLA